MRGQPGGRALLCLVVDEGTSMVLGKVPVFIDGVPSGYVTSAAYGHTVRTPLAYAWLPAETVEGDNVQIQYFVRMIPATVAAGPLFEPKMERLRS